MNEQERQEAADHFEALILAWQQAASACANVEEQYTLVHATALARSEGKNAEARAADAASRSAPERGVRDVRRIEEQAARWRVQWHLARAGRQGRWEP